MVPELRSTVLSGADLENCSTVRSLLPELAFLFHRIDSLGRFALISAPSGSKVGTRVGAWAPSNFISSLATMPETEQLQILDGSPAAVDPPRRPEAFYRFLLYQVDKEAIKCGELAPSRRLDAIGGIDFVSINEFISGSDPLSHSTTRAMTIDLHYEGLERTSIEGGRKHVRFADVVQRTLCRENRLRAWSQSSKSYETIVQRKIATSLPAALSISCACAGRKVEEGLVHWRERAGEGSNWLPETIVSGMTCLL
jgi:Ubiquitin carboxyl-terminal hydrolase